MRRSIFNIVVFNFVKKIIGSNNSKYLLFKLNESRIHKQKIVFIHIPKAAGTSIATAIYGKRIGHFSFDDYKRYLGANFGNYPVFTVLRDPYDRLYSAYCYAVQGGTNEGAIANASLYKTYPFRDFNSFINEWLVYQDINTVDLIFRPQVVFLSLENGLNKNNISLFCLSRLEEIEDFLTKVLGRKIVINRINVTVRAEKKYFNQLNANAIKIIEDIYKADLLFFKGLAE